MTQLANISYNLNFDKKIRIAISFIETIEMMKELEEIGFTNDGGTVMEYLFTPEEFVASGKGFKFCLDVLKKYNFTTSQTRFDVEAMEYINQSKANV